MSLSSKWVVLLIAALVGALILSPMGSESGYEETLIGVQIRQESQALGAEIASQPLLIQALMLDYLADPVLVLAARLALTRQPRLAGRILSLYGAEPEFQAVLLRYGDPVLPVIGYFMDTEISTLEWRHRLGAQYARFRSTLAEVLDEPETSLSAARGGEAPSPELTPEEKGWYAIHVLHEEGYDFLGQFTTEAAGRVQWVQTERVLESINAVFLGGVRRLETRWRREQAIQAADFAWAGLDVVALAASVKLVKAVKGVSMAGQTSHRLSLSSRTALIGSRLIARSGGVGIAIAKWGAVPAAIYLMLRYPSLINATLGELADWAGLPRAPVRFLFWYALVLGLTWIGLFLIRPIRVILEGLAWILRWLDGRLAPIPSRGDPPSFFSPWVQGQASVSESSVGDHRPRVGCVRSRLRLSRFRS